MAIAQPGSLVYAIRGKVGNEVYSIWKGLQVVKAYNAAPFKDPASDKMVFIQGLMTAANTAWGTLSDAEKQSWESVAALQKRLPNKRYPTGGVENLVPENHSRAYGQDIFRGNFINARRHGIGVPGVLDLLNEQWNALGTWIEGGNGTSDINPPGFLRLLPDANDFIMRYKDIGVLPDDGYTAHIRQYFEDLGVKASDNVAEYQFFDGVHIIYIKVGTDMISVQKNDLSFENKVIDTAADTWYDYLISVDSDDHSLKLYRKTDATLWVFVHEFTDLRNGVGDDGLVRTIQRRGGAGSSQSHQDFFEIATGLFDPTILPQPPFVTAPLSPPQDLALFYAAGLLTADWVNPVSWDPTKHRVGVWAYGYSPSDGRAYRQWLGYQPDTAMSEFSTRFIYLAAIGSQIIDAIKPLWLYVQVYTCDISTGLISDGGETKKIDIL